MIVDMFLVHTIASDTPSDRSWAAVSVMIIDMLHVHTVIFWKLFRERRAQRYDTQAWVLGEQEAVSQLTVL
jgi:hypothetical protein